MNNNTNLKLINKNDSLNFLKQIIATKAGQEKLARDMSKLLTNNEVNLRYVDIKNNSVHLFGWHYCDYGVSIYLTDFLVTGSYDYGCQENNERYLKYMHSMLGDKYKDAFFKDSRQQTKNILNSGGKQND